jgi:hypothetical protein
MTSEHGGCLGQKYLDSGASYQWQRALGSIAGAMYMCTSSTACRSAHTTPYHLSLRHYDLLRTHPIPIGLMTAQTLPVASSHAQCAAAEHGATSR